MSNRKQQPIKPTPQAPYVIGVDLAQVLPPKFVLKQIRSSRDEWVRYGDNNLFPDYLMSTVKDSENHSAFISLRENMIKGAGVSMSDNIKGFLNQLDEDGTTFEDLLEDWATDMSIQETFAVFVRFSRDRKKIAALDYLDSSKVRPEKIQPLTEDEIKAGVLPKIRGYWVSEDWSDLQNNPAVRYERFSLERDSRGKLIAPESTTQLYFYHKRANGQPYLPEVSYASCLNYVKMESEMSKYGLNTMLNGFFASAILSVAGSMSEEQKRSFTQGVNNTFAGSENASKLMVVVNETPDSVKITPLSTGDNTNMLKALKEASQEAIATAHRCQPVLAGVQSSAGLSSDGKLIKSAQELFHNNVIRHLQKPIMSFMKKVLLFNGIEEYDLSIETLNLVSDDVPEWIEQELIKPEVVAVKYGYKVDDIRPELRTPEAGDTPQEPTPAAPLPEETKLQNPYPKHLR